ncbi:tonB-system energizer ExbB [Stenotrophomonas sp. SbOxS2]|uniref:tonB-system energizer ExbB n=1 Tax=Stenotrophomonas sp. SbOxS2 TaxID=2723885 RepID=UPI00211EA08D|nr:tonB-system energizer ExbB [Stenotrophomonas sp. SbOxS2]
MTHDLTVAAMFLQADWVVKAVMGVLMLASVATLSIWIFKGWEIVSHRRAIASALKSLSGGGELASFTQLPDPAAAAMIQAAIGELERYPAGERDGFADGIKERVAAQILRVEAGQQRKLSRGASVLGSIGAAAPFIGLFGTVWGIMHSFIGIAQSQTTNLAVVAPGIAEALLATAFGLVAAIPAVLVYNAVTRAIAGYRVRMKDAATQVMCLLSLELEGDLSARRRVEPPHGV